MSQSFDNSWEEKYFNESSYRNHYPWSFIVSHAFGVLKKINLDRPLKILEIGCGTGNNLIFLAKEGFNTSGIDGSKTAISYAKSWSQRENLKIDFHLGDFSSLPFEDNEFDFIFDRAAISLSNFEGIKKTIDEMHRVLKTSGHAMINPYSDHCSSFHKTPNEDGTIKNIKYGTVFGAGGQVTFLGFGEIKKILKNKWIIRSFKHVSETEMSKPHREQHAEWQIIIKPVK